MFGGSIGPLELILIAFILLLIFGGKRLSGLGSAMGSFIKNFKKSLNEPEDKETKEKSQNNVEVK